MDASKSKPASSVEEAKPLQITQWAPEDRPREKLMLKGISALSDAELIAILLSTGTARMTAVDIGKKLMSSVDGSLRELATRSVDELKKIRGIGAAKAISIVAAMELGRRTRQHADGERPKITSSRDAYEVVKPFLMDLPHEVFWVILVNRANRVMKTRQISQGGVAGTVADPKIIFNCALQHLASGIIVAHNHPSGNLSPSQADIDLTKKIREGGRVLEIQVLDHIIVAGQKYFSFADEGLF